MSRRESAGEGHQLLSMPNIECAEYIIQMWHEAGTVGQGGMGITPLSWQEIAAWRDNTEVDISLYELQMIKMLSGEYVGEYHAASDKHRQAPYQIAPEEVDYIAQGNRFKNILRGLAKKNVDSDPRYTTEENN